MYLSAVCLSVYLSVVTCALSLYQSGYHSFYLQGLCAMTLYDYQAGESAFDFMCHCTLYTYYNLVFLCISSVYSSVY